MAKKTGKRRKSNEELISEIESRLQKQRGAMKEVDEWVIQCLGNDVEWDKTRLTYLRVIQQKTPSKGLPKSVERLLGGMSETEAEKIRQALLAVKTKASEV